MKACQTCSGRDMAKETRQAVAAVMRDVYYIDTEETGRIADKVVIWITEGKITARATCRACDRTAEHVEAVHLLDNGMYA